ncbi:BTAD domain-containing putative transcriptional regulator [Umezawaea sp. Da 62-37]|uniref:AfsR/SARP family transcriptional regulator n=1 Tax=Umezawaea sp. Da 62-37 TaxID=3075927 RepID=UPI0028F6FC44|nr:BTAD domain-containing putative transcriptional regulator [Umezawaea sp. Da 62-37]WNV86823.1 BTAD domain-containing putative transcriptional regulator [Umezawaea sp. Da 62-37]
MRRWVFLVLGPLEVRDGGRVITIRSAKQRVLLSALLATPNESVHVDELIDHLWGAGAPGAARGTLQTYVMRLRQFLDDGTAREIVRTTPTGYSIHVDSDQLDLTRFRELRAGARAAEESGDLDAESALLDEAVGLWRGPAFVQVPSRRDGTADADRLDEQRWEAVERRNEVELLLGRHENLVDELLALVALHPLRERFWAQLMSAQHRGGRQAQALDTYRRAREVLAEELGIEPNAELRRLHQSVLAGRTGPAWLPPAVPDFTGRAAEVEAITSGLRGVWTITGLGGVGKTTLAVHVAHLVRDDYPDGQLYLNLRGTGVGPAEALDRLLRGLGVPGSAIPASLDDRIGLYRDRLADRRVLVVLDNAADEAQVRPLLPGTPTAAVLITSRTALAGLEGARVVPLEVFPAEDALGLLRGALGAKRVDAEPEAAREIAGYCGRLPLALRIAVGRLVARPHWRLAQLAGRLEDQRGRLDELRVGDLDVRASLALSHDGLDATRRRLFGLLARLDCPDFAAGVAAPLLDLGLDEAEEHVEALVDARLVDFAGRDTLGRQRYRLHDLVRVFGREVADDDPAPLLRLFDTWRDLAERVNADLPQEALRLPERERPYSELAARLPADPVAWLDDEWLGIRAAVAQAAELGMAEQVCGLVIATGAFCDLRARFDDWEWLIEVALPFATRDTEPVLVQQRGILRVRQHRFDEAEADFDRARLGFEAVGDDWGAGYAWYASGWMHEWRGRPERARECHRQATVRFRASSNAHGEVEVLASLGAIARRAGDFDEALAHLTRGRDLATVLDDERGVFGAVLELGRLLRFTGELDTAAEHLATALTLAERMGDPDMAAIIRLFLADVLLRAGHEEVVDELVRQAHAYLEEHDDRVGLVWSWRLLSARSADPAIAVGWAERALEASVELGLDPEVARSLCRLGYALTDVGRHDEADRAWSEASALFTGAGFHAEAAEVPVQVR